MSNDPARQAPLVSVVMPVFNGAAHLDDAVESVLAQTFPNLELVAVDDGSTDDSWEILTSYARHDPRVRPQRLSVNSGHHVASNTACERAVGQYLVRLDQDDLMSLDRVSWIVEAFENHPEVGLVYSSYERWLPDGTRIIRTPPTSDPTFRLAQMFANYVCHSSLAFRAETFAALPDGYRDLPGPQDYDLIVRMLAQTRSLCIAEPLAVYRQETMAMSTQFAGEMQGAVDDISDHQLESYLPADRTASARRVYLLHAGPSDWPGVSDVRMVFDGATASMPAEDRAEARAFARRWTARALRAMIAPRGGLPRTTHYVARLCIGDPVGAAVWAIGEGRSLLNKLAKRVMSRHNRGAVSPGS